jgi:hypothetical protein
VAETLLLSPHRPHRPGKIHATPVDFEWLDALRKNHPAWRLLAADHAPLVVSFLYRVFVSPNLRSLQQRDLISALDDHLLHVRQLAGESTFPRSAAEYVDDWCSVEKGWLRRYYRPGEDEPHCDLTPATEKAIGWLAAFRTRPFVATESRLMMVFDLLRQIVEGVETNPDVRLAELKSKRAQIDAAMERIRGGSIDQLDATQVKDRFLQMAATARALLSDFREVEQNFRDLDRGVREKIAQWEGGKGALLEQIFGERDAIADSDQGRSFRAFWDFLISPSRQEELSRLLETVFAIEAVQSLDPDPRLRRIHYDWLEAGEVAQRTVARLSHQLRRYLDEQAWQENRRIIKLIRQIEQKAIEVRSVAPEGTFSEISDTAPAVELPFERPLFRPALKPKIVSSVVAGEGDISTEALFDQVYVDRARLQAHIRRALQARAQISLAGLVAIHPLEQGLAELVTYLALASEDARAMVDESSSETFEWMGADGRPRRATLPLVIFGR